MAVEGNGWDARQDGTERERETRTGDCIGLQDSTVAIRRPCRSIRQKQRREAHMDKL